MLIKIDWLSFSIPMDTSKMETEQDAPAQVITSLEHLQPNLPEWLSMGDEYEVRNGRAPYRTSWHRADGGLTVFSHPVLSHALIEISGRGCDRLQTSATLEQVLSAVTSRITRIDIACDILTNERPKEWAEDRHIGRFTSHSYVTSESGQTFYVGAKTFDRYARVYRYSAPHERSHLLRVEYVIKAENAKIMADAILSQGMRPVVASLWDTFGWNRGKDDLDPTAAEIATYRPDRREGKTLFWLADTIAPLLARLHKEAVIDLDVWVNENVRTKLKD